VQHNGRVTTPGLDSALARVGDRWTLLVVDALLAGPRRFGELAELLPGIAPNVLTARLRQLERAGLLHGRPYQRRPVRFEYALTETGRALADALAVLGAWGALLDGTPAVGPVHELCGTPLELVWWCPTCERVVRGAHSDERDDYPGDEVGEELHHL
jgi:DNA-binding HxlR family transcriptional regulator